jgi:hypothetical protein
VVVATSLVLGELEGSRGETGEDTYFSRSTNVMFSAISATRLAMREAMMPYGDGWPLAPAPLAVFCGRTAGFLAREAVGLLVVRLTGAEATEAGILDDAGDCR